MTGYYDIVLGLIPLSLAGLTALLLAAGMSLSASVPLASIASLGLMGHAMFVNGPVAAPTTPNGGQTMADAPASGNVPSLE
jgi:hypothetical protein